MKHFTKALPILSIALALILDIVLPDNLQHPAAEHPYFIWLLGAALVVYLIFYAVSFFRPSLREKLEYKAYFYAGAALFLNILNLLTVKFAILPVLYFPSLDRVFGVLFEDSAFLAKCLAYSARLLFIGWFCGAIVGMLTGIAIGFNKNFSYWVQPLVRVLGPIPSTAWIPIVLIAFPSAVSASAFLIALAVWFPTTVLTSSGIAAIPNAYFEVSSTLGAGSFYRIAKVGIPAAMPHKKVRTPSRYSRRISPIIRHINCSCSPSSVYCPSAPPIMQQVFVFSIVTPPLYSDLSLILTQISELVKYH